MNIEIISLAHHARKTHVISFDATSNERAIEQGKNLSRLQFTRLLR